MGTGGGLVGWDMAQPKLKQKTYESEARTQRQSAAQMREEAEALQESSALVLSALTIRTQCAEKRPVQPLE